MSKVDGLSIAMIMGDWRLIIEALEEKNAKNIAIDLDSVNEDKAAEICEDIDKIQGILAYLKQEYKKQYGIISLS